MWWVSYRGEGRAGVENIGVFNDDGTPREKHPLLLDDSPDAAPLKIARGFALVGDNLYIARLAQGKPYRPLPPASGHLSFRQCAG